VIVGIKIRNFRAIKLMPWLKLDPLHVLIGPNGSGKSTFLDAIEFIKDCLDSGPANAVELRAPEFRDLTFLRRGGPIEIDLRFRFTADVLNRILHYRLALTADKRLGVRVTEELLQVSKERQAKGDRILGKTSTGNDFYRRDAGTYVDSFQFGPNKLALSLTPPDTQKYATANMVKEFLMQGVRYLRLNSSAMRQPAPALRSTELDLDGTNLARVVGGLINESRSKNGGGERSGALARWTRHLQYAIDDLESIGWAAREPDNAEYLVLRFKGGLSCPSWLLSDGTLRMLALTLLAFLPTSSRHYMIEEPENGVHPLALEVILKALSAIPAAQVLIATHSPLVVQQLGIEPLLCFSRDPISGVQIVRGAAHPVLKGWSGTPDLASIFASRVLG
jgi:predicted ATPase